MSPTEALGILSKIAFAYRGTREDHDIIGKAIETISTSINKKPEADPAKSKKEVDAPDVVEVAK